MNRSIREFLGDRCLVSPAHLWRVALGALGLVAALSGCQKADPPSSAPLAYSVTRDEQRGTDTTEKGSLLSGLERKKSSAGASNAALRHECSRFSDVAHEAGIRFTYQNGAAGQWLMIEATGGGCGWLDYDRDGQWDLYLPQGGDATLGPIASQPADALFRNVGEGRFAPVADQAGISEHRYSQGIAVGDFDNDGFDDVLVTNVGPDVLYHNQGDGTFVDVTASSIGFDSLWSTSAAWGDVDRDGDLDLYVCNYVDFDLKNPRICHDAKGRPATCHPIHMQPVPDEFYLNDGAGGFTAVARERGLSGPGNFGLGVVIADLNNDGWPDIYVANDTKPNFLFINQKDGMFVESAALLGCAVNCEGNPQASMGATLGDYDRNGWLDLFLTHFTNEWNTLYRNLGPQGFQDVSARVGLVDSRRDKLGFGTVMADFNHDGFDELLVANGHIDDQSGYGRDTAMNPQLFAFDGRRFVECTAEAGPFFAEKLLGRGVAACDYDGDGDLDLAFVSQNAPAALLRNDSRGGHWLKLEFTGRTSNRRGIGTRATVTCGGNSIVQELAGGTSYCATHQPALNFGLGDSAAPVEVEIRWPSGVSQVLREIAPDQLLRLIEPDSGEAPDVAQAKVGDQNADVINSKPAANNGNR